MMPRVRPVPRCARPLVAFALLTALYTAAAHAAEFEVEAETIGQGYQLRSCYADPMCRTLLDRRRLTQYLNLHAFRFLPDDWTGHKHVLNLVFLTPSMRIYPDFCNYLIHVLSGQDL